MNIHHNKQSQFELFPGASKQPAQKTKPFFLMSQVTLTFENLIVLSVVIIMCMVMSFSLGVDRGSKSALIEKPSQVDLVKVDSGEEQENYNNAEPEILGASVAPIKEIAVSEVKKQASKINQDLEAIGEKTTANIEKFYTVQVASFRKEEYAQKEAMGLKKKGYEILVVPKGDYSIVCVGKFSHYNEAKLFSRKLKNMYRDCLVRSL